MTVIRWRSGRPLAGGHGARCCRSALPSASSRSPAATRRAGLTPPAGPTSACAGRGARGRGDRPLPRWHAIRACPGVGDRPHTHRGGRDAVATATGPGARRGRDTAPTLSRTLRSRAHGMRSGGSGVLGVPANSGSPRRWRRKRRFAALATHSVSRVTRLGSDGWRDSSRLPRRLMICLLIAMSSTSSTRRTS